MRNLLLAVLKFLSGRYLAKFKPKLIGITGSVGKTTTKEAIAFVLASKFKVRSSPENYNNEVGVPLSIIGEHSAGKNIFGWLAILIKGFLKLFNPNFPKVLVLEMGTDRPGDISYLVRIAGKLDVAVLTDIGISHLEFFGSPEALAKEKLSILKGVKPDGTAVLNFDSPKIVSGSASFKGKVLSFGFEPKSDVWASDFQIIKMNAIWGVTFKVHHQGTVVPFFIPDVLGKPVVYAALAAICAGLKFDFNLVEISEVLKKFIPPAGRMRLIKGIKQTTIIDDTYNSAPSSTLAALEALSMVAPGRKIAVLGAMAELGPASESGHREVAGKILEYGISSVFLVGSETRFIEDELRRRKFTGAVACYESSDHARLPVQNELLEGDFILIKGSQAMRMERVVKEIMANPMEADKLLVRQSEKWLHKP
ncbi:MAG TPA: UDP-N-acetylmuramoyl-tripeptide--D-alanyl-D-alanine ligase [Patescibacteria group bacterium]|jgi:UDP-N-acetylmuramoyl-tripeptide--D-alanyl-D-alanine ligase|nr:UDP-N-acetylmuramoyl-tripeptide--D-alanyl-D-alanine ligase [Patescibacteria group bacterium]